MSGDGLERLEKMLALPGCEHSPMSRDELCDLLYKYGDIEKAAYHGCIKLAQRSAITAADGTSMPDQRDFWLSMAAMYRPSRSRIIRRADDA